MAIKKKSQEFQPSYEIRRVVSLNGGRWAYVFDLKGRTHHLKTDSEEFISLCRELNEASDGRVERDLTVLGWESILESSD